MPLDPALREVVDEAVPLTESAWKTRYPGDPDPSEAEARDALAVARIVYDEVLARLSREVRP